MFSTKLKKNELFYINKYYVYVIYFLFCLNRLPCLLRTYSNSVVRINKKIGFIGDGNMAKAVCKAIESKGLVSYSQVYVSSPYPKYLADWKRRGANVYTNNAEVATNADLIFLAVKPVIFPAVMEQLLKSDKLPLIKDKLFVSILAGIKIQDLEKVIYYCM